MLQRMLWKISQNIIKSEISRNAITWISIISSFREILNTRFVITLSGCYVWSLQIIILQGHLISCFCSCDFTVLHALIYIGVMVSALILVHGATVYREYCKNCLTQGKELSDWSQLVSAVAVVLITRVTLWLCWTLLCRMLAVSWQLRDQSFSMIDMSCVMTIAGPKF
jgi:hypothetical protein